MAVSIILLLCPPPSTSRSLSASSSFLLLRRRCPLARLVHSGLPCLGGPNVQAGGVGVIWADEILQGLE
eukprot:1716149-Alexandrium_andersonii.AAC.1